MGADSIYGSRYHRIADLSLQHNGSYAEKDLGFSKKYHLVSL